MALSRPKVARHQRLADLCTVVSAPAIVLSQPSGDIGLTPIEGYFLDDRRVLSELRILVDGDAVDHLATAQPRPGTARFVGVVAHGSTSEADFGLEGDALVSIRRERELSADGLLERIVLCSSANRAIELDVDMMLATDASDVSVARTGASAARTPAHTVGTDGVEWPLPEGSVRAAFSPAPSGVHADDGRVRASWRVVLEPGQTAGITLRVVAVGSLQHPLRAPESPSALSGSDTAAVRLFARSLADADALTRADEGHSRDRYVAAGAPWYLTLFGRDSLWAARMLLPFRPTLAHGTLRALARRQGMREDPRTAEQPGKILHEVRRPGVARLLPPTYYGTADATALWIILLVEAWRWGMPRAEVAELLPNLHRALAWLERAAAAGQGFIEYHPDGHGLANQGWKDSRDAIHDREGRHHEGPVALAEVQGYAHHAAAGAGDLLEAFDEPDADRWRFWAERLAHRFAERFWVEHDGMIYPATAIIARTHLADSVTSNMGHLVETGIVPASGIGHIAARLGADDLASPFGLRTLSTLSPRFNPFSYHNGSIWPHDTAIAVRGLAGAGHGHVARRLTRGLLDAATSFDFRLPELWSGDVAPGAASGSSPRPVPYPTACSPQAWSAAGIAAIAAAAVGVIPDAPAGTVRLDPPRVPLLGAIEVTGMRFGGLELDVALDEAGVASARLDGIPAEATGVR